jgi:hypothetical protein
MMSRFKHACWLALCSIRKHAILPRPHRTQLRFLGSRQDTHPCWWQTFRQSNVVRAESSARCCSIGVRQSYYAVFGGMFGVCVRVSLVPFILELPFMGQWQCIRYR